MTYLRRSRNPFAAPKRKKVSRVGKATGTVRLVGPDMGLLREKAYNRAAGRCEMRLVCNGQYVPWKDGHLAHRKSRGSGGADVLQDASGKQVLWTCPACHIQSHAYGVSKSKPVPAKSYEKSAGGEPRMGPEISSAESLQNSNDERAHETTSRSDEPPATPVHMPPKSKPVPRKEA